MALTASNFRDEAMYSAETSLHSSSMIPYFYRSNGIGPNWNGTGTTMEWSWAKMDRIGTTMEWNWAKMDGIGTTMEWNRDINIIER